MDNNPLISIICVTYNHEKFISECLESIINQTYKYWELLIIDDGSLDKTTNIIKNYIKFDSRIKIYPQKNVGIYKLSESYNRALSLAKGEYIAIIEGDDAWMPNKLEKQILIVDVDPEAVLIWGKIIKISNEQKALGTVPDLPEANGLFNNEPIGSIFKILVHQNPIPAVSMLIQKTALIEIGGFQQCFNLPLVDLPTICKLAIKGKFHYIDEILGYWREYPDQITKTYPVEILKGREKLLLHFLSTYNLNISIKEVQKDLKKQLIIAYSRSGRYKLIRGEFTEARKDYIKSIFSPNFYEIRWRLRSIIGIVFSLFKKDIENFMRIIGRKSYK